VGLLCVCGKISVWVDLKGHTDLCFPVKLLPRCLTQRLPPICQANNLKISIKYNNPLALEPRGITAISVPIIRVRTSDN
jgi:hypothetical protein